METQFFHSKQVTFLFCLCYQPIVIRFDLDGCDWNRWIMEPKFLCCVILAQMCLQAIIFGTTIPIGHATWHHCTAPENEYFFYMIIYFRLVWSSFWNMFLIVPAYLLRRYANDGFGVKTDFKLIGLSLLTAIIALLIAALVLRSYQSTALFVDYLAFAFATAVIGVTLYRPVRLSYQWQRRVLAIGNIGSLLELLRLPGR
jgi:hypothetical protein